MLSRPETTTLYKKLARKSTGGLIAGLMVVTLPFLFYSGLSESPPASSVSEVAVRSSLTTLVTRTYKNHIPRPTRDGGAIANISDDFLVATGDGTMYLAEINPRTENLTVTPLPLSVPMNLEEFRTDVAADTNLDGFRTSDLLVLEHPNSISLLAAHHFWSRENQCFVVRASQIVTTDDQLTNLAATFEWETIFESEPCLPYRTASTPFIGYFLGGRLASIDANNIAISLGDHGYDGVNGVGTDPMYAQDDDVDYGKIIRVDLSTLETTTISKGHRNPQGLLVSSLGEIWSTEHGPEGGDELNKIRDGANYGWPLVTYGTQYGLSSWPLSSEQGRHKGYEQPVFAWVPSVGISNLLEIQSDLFSMWKGDLLVASLGGNSLFRVRLVNEHPVVVEPISVPHRLRDMVELPTGKIVIWTDRGRLVTIEPTTDNLTGQAHYEQRCSGCHLLGEGRSHRLGPDLGTVIGRRVATAPAYSYSLALMNLGGTWTEERLDAFLRNAGEFAPGTSMTAGYTNLEDEEIRRAIIEFLASPR